MTRAAFLGSVCLIFLSCGALPACGQQDETRAVLAQCSDPPPGHLDSCLERARVLSETNPTPEVQALVGMLIQRQIRESEAAHAPDTSVDPDHPPDDNGVSSYDTAPPEPPPSSDLGPLEPYQSPPDTNSQQSAPPEQQGSPSDMGPPDSSASPDYSRQSLPPPPPPPGGGPGRGT